MDVFLEYVDYYAAESAYRYLAAHTAVPYLEPTNLIRQFITLTLAVDLGVNLLYFTVSPLSYYLVFDRTLEQHPKFLKNQIRQEIIAATKAFLPMTILTVPWFMMEVHGYSRLYENVSLYGWPYFFLTILLFLLFTDFGVYWIHRLLHHRLIYAKVHKPHHKWIIPTPFAAFAFNYLDGYLQSVPYHLAVFVFPIHKYLYLGLFVFVQLWTVMIHDGEYMSTNPIINGSAHHTVHHIYFNYNYGQYFTLWDRVFGSHRYPPPEVTDRELRNSKSIQKDQAKDVEDMLPTLELKSKVA
ncbi:c-5 sterol desaturase [Dimargaris cristalligena]|uniref:C-5 sterol desaturase erg31 n=1 Tax=Dimargaris cristalligena TaxID=215637 RepID=A0A4P9ZX47_9FUNG|nr:c-5 sterol desaturase [Dimargaris cristalligena]RKP37928.1 C-5 sterol desaturase erg31 [Dimargaris cristalligena]|eukprot:RKP37928.1 C-5 sterol desaturase erg31 [Dimargaris cristalligena]